MRGRTPRGVASDLPLSKDWPIPFDSGVPVRSLVLRFLSDRSGNTAIEYGLIAAAIACIVIGSVQKIGTNLKNNFSSIQNALK